MNRFQPSTPRTAFGLTAAFMTALTISIAVVVPAKMDVSAQQERFAQTAAHVASAAAVDRAAHAKQG